jgi:alpha-tubulin suppressor-like RCC1 family protein
VLAAIGNRTLSENEFVTFTISATDPNNDQLTYAAYSVPSGASFSATAHSFTWTPNYNQAGVYYVRFRVTDPIGLYAEQIVTITVTDVAGSNAPSNLIAQVTSLTQTDLAWTDNSMDELGFKIEQKIGETGSYSQIATVGADVLSYSSADLLGGTLYGYRVRSYNAAGNSAYSNEVSIATTALTMAPSIVNNYITNVSHNTATLYGTINPNGLATNAYFQYGATNTYGTNTTAYPVGSDTTNVNLSADITGLSPNTTYHFRIVATNNIGASYGQDQAFTTAAVPYPPIVGAVSALNISYNSVSLTGTANPNSKDTTVYFQYGTSTAYQYATVLQNIGSGTGDINVTADLTGILADTEYHYRLLANNIDGLSLSADQTFRTTTGPPNARTNYVSDINITSAVLNGIVNPNGLTTTAYFEWGLTTAYGSSTTVQDIGTGVTDTVITATLNSLSIDTNYYYRLVAVNSAGTTNGANQVFIITAPTAPSNLTATATSPSSIWLAWTDASNNEDGFKIERAPASGGQAGTYAQVGTAGVNAVSFSDSSVTTTVTYYYRIRAFNNIGDSAYSNEVSATTPLAWLAVAGGAYHTVAIKSDGTLWAWGFNSYGQLGLGDNTDRNTPTQVGTDTDWKSVAAGYYHTMAIKTNGSLWGWGGNGYGQLGVSDTVPRNTPTQVSYYYWWWYSNWSSVSCGYYHTIAIRTDGTLWTWGYNAYGQLGLGNTESRLYPNQASGGTDWSSVAGGFYHSLAVKSTGTLWSTGYNGNGQLGLGDTATRYSFTQVGLGTDWAVVAAGCYHSVAYKKNNMLWTWGYNGYGQLALGDYGDRTTPAQEINTSTDWVAVAGGYHHTIVLKRISGGQVFLGTIWAAGYNASGQLGVGDLSNRNYPIQAGTGNNWATIAGGFYHTIALESNGNLWAWGANNYGQLGLGNYTDRIVPTRVP